MSSESLILCPRQTPVIRPSLHPEYQHELSGGVHRFLKEDTAQRLDAFLSAFKKYRADRGETIPDPKIYDQLPFVDFDKALWGLRQRDIELLQSLPPLKQPSDILDMGSWNGWLSNWLTQKGHSVTAIDYFDDEFDGLRARKHYTNPLWTSIQMDLREFQVIDKSFDLIVLNRCLYALPDAGAVLRFFKTRLNPGGMIVMTGVNLIRDGREQAEQRRKVSADFEAQYGVPYGLFNFSSHFSPEKKEELEKLGVTFHDYAQMGLKNFVSRLQRKRPAYLYGLLSAD